ncbi:High-affinity zinc uptake system protein ZnuA [Sinobacterium norvegicum]|uniref:High-affinity zinc uptake system protein ZnuA n=1 Tax=Sinobacterium norvegicum TaxID=1641715 RepID=A0ABM9AIU2_9GAMM|nr:metal ABC transporter substrate-binding protein [Sinobacterium norvegicum]CAH0992982.1 High-affinity zinc uptake system protein ZnuA [Sinobacterium norvegicum]
MLFRSPILAACLLAIFTLPASADSNNATVMTTVKPMAMLLRAIAPASVEVAYLVRDGHSGHHYHMRPSEGRALQQSRQFYWLGAEFEPIMSKAAQHPSSVNLTQGLANMPTLTKGGSHLWMNPVTAMALAESAASSLTSAYPDNAEEIAANLAALKQQVATIDQQLRADLSDSQQRDFVALHDAYGNLASHYGLTQLAAFYGEHEQSLGAASRAALQQQLQGVDNVCIFSQPQFALKPVETLLADHQLTVLELDPLAADIEFSSHGFQQFMQHIGRELPKCF